MLLPNSELGDTLITGGLFHRAPAVLADSLFPLGIAGLRRKVNFNFYLVPKKLPSKCCSLGFP